MQFLKSASHLVAKNNDMVKATDITLIPHADVRCEDHLNLITFGLYFHDVMPPYDWLIKSYINVLVFLIKVDSKFIIEIIILHRNWTGSLAAVKSFKKYNMPKIDKDL